MRRWPFPTQRCVSRESRPVILGGWVWQRCRICRRWLSRDSWALQDGVTSEALQAQFEHYGRVRHPRDSRQKFARLHAIKLHRPSQTNVFRKVRNVNITQNKNMKGAWTFPRSYLACQFQFKRMLAGKGVPRKAWLWKHHTDAGVETHYPWDILRHPETSSGIRRISGAWHAHCHRGVCPSGRCPKGNAGHAEMSSAVAIGGGRGSCAVSQTLNVFTIFWYPEITLFI